MEYSKKLIIFKLLLNSFILLTAILTILFGIFQVEWYLQEFEYSEPFNIVWNYGLFINSNIYYTAYIHGPSLNIILSIFFVQGVFTQFILYRNFDRSIIYYSSLVLMILGLLGSLLWPMFIFGITGDDLIFFDFWQNLAINKTVLPGFYWGLLSIFLIVIKIITTKLLESKCRLREL